MGNAWNIVQGWVDSQPVEINDAQLSRALGVAQSNFDIWKNPKKLPAHEAIGAIAKLTQTDYKVVLEAFIEDIGYAEAPTDEQLEKRRAKRAGRSRGTLEDQAKRELSPKKPQTQIAKETKSDKRPQSDVG